MLHIYTVEYSWENSFEKIIQCMGGERRQGFDRTLPQVSVVLGQLFFPETIKLFFLFSNDCQ